jgi:RNA polymerase sigma-70 factor (ECF subfamily)
MSPPNSSPASIASAPPCVVTDDSRWFRDEVQPHESALRAFLRSHFPSLSDVDDLVQESYARLIRARTAGEVKNLKAYLFATARHAALDICRHNKIVTIERIEDYDDLHVLDSNNGLVDSVCREQEIAVLQEAIASLPPRCREVLALRKLHGLSREDIARQMGIAEGTVNIHISVGMLRCRKFFAERGLIKDEP